MRDELSFDYGAAAPEILLAVASMALLMYGVFRPAARAARETAWLAVAALLVTLVVTLALPEGRTVTFAGAFVVDGFAVYVKALILIGSVAVLLMSIDVFQRDDMDRFELPVLMVIATLGMMMMVSANDLISLYISVELQSLALYVCAAVKRDSLRSTEAGLKYFMLGALSSGMLLYGASLIYGFTGTTSFEVLAAVGTAMQGEPPLGLLVGIVFLAAGLAFKVSAVPFHMWTPDVYEGAPTPVTAFLAVAPKIAAIALFVRAMMGPFPDLLAQWQQIIVAISVASMMLGAFAALWQTNIKRLMAYSSIGHVGYALMGLAAGGTQGAKGVLIYLVTYLAMNAGTFAVILCMRHRTGPVENISDLAGLNRNQPMLALAMLFFMFSMAGVPPLAGFFGKYYVFVATLEAGLYALAVIGVLTSVVGAFYYLRIVKLMYFDEPAEAFEPARSPGLRVVLTVSAVFTAIFFVIGAPFIEGAELAARTLVAHAGG
jgi:NADH-quinone oxidoreductase subunit N